MRKIYLDKNLQFVFGVTLMAVLGVSSIVPALPDMITGLKVDPTHIGWVISAFTLPGVLFSPVVGILADRMGRKKLLVPSLFIFGGFGAACFFATSWTALLTLRFCQGIGAAPLGVMYGTIIGDLYEGRERAEAMGYNASVLAMGTALYPGIGGALALLGWYYPFLLPLAAIPLGLAMIRYMDIPEPRSNSRFMEYLRAALGQMKTREVLSLFATTFLTFIVLYGPIITYLPILLDQRYKASSMSIGLVILSASLITGVASFKLGRLTDRFGHRVLLMVAGLFYTLCMVGIPLMPGLWLTVLPVLCFGLAQGLNIPTIMTMLTTIAPMEQRGAFMAANGLLLRLAQTAAPVLMGFLYAAWGLNGVYAGGAVAALSIMVLAFFCDCD